MEFVSKNPSIGRRRRRKFRRKRIKFEVKSAKGQRISAECGHVFFGKKRITGDTMQADAFWKNYVAAQEWQKRHSVIWWKSRCIALENENKILRNKVRSLACRSNDREITSKEWQNNPKESDHFQDDEEENDDYGNDGNYDNEDLEFHVNADMMTFLEQSIRHKMELKEKRELEWSKDEDVFPLEGGAAWARAKSEEAKLLYGEASPTILAMEAALQATVDRHKDKSKARYWPNIPLRP